MVNFQKIVNLCDAFHSYTGNICILTELDYFNSLEVVDRSTYWRSVWLPQMRNVRYARFFYVKHHNKQCEQIRLYYHAYTKYLYSDSRWICTQINYYLGYRYNYVHDFLLVTTTTRLLCKAKMQYLLTWKIRRYCLLALHRNLRLVMITM